MTAKRKLVTEPVYTVGQTVFDLPSAQCAVIQKVDLLPGCKGAKVYELDASVPLNPTGDDAYNDRYRLSNEICLPVNAAREQKRFTY